MARSGDGVDIGAVYELLAETAGKLNELILTVNEHSRRFDEVAAVLNGHGHKFDDLSRRMTDLHDAVGHYHYSVVGHGIAVNLLEDG